MGKFKWSFCATECLLDLWEKELPNIKANKKNYEIYKKIAETLQRAGVHANIDDIKTKRDTLIRRYKCERHKNASTWDHFKKMDEIMGASIALGETNSITFNQVYLMGPESECDIFISEDMEKQSELSSFSFAARKSCDDDQGTHSIDVDFEEDNGELGIFLAKEIDEWKEQPKHPVIDYSKADLIILNPEEQNVEHKVVSPKQLIHKNEQPRHPLGISYDNRNDSTHSLTADLIRLHSEEVKIKDILVSPKEINQKKKQPMHAVRKSCDDDLDLGNDSADPVTADLFELNSEEESFSRDDDMDNSSDSSTADSIKLNAEEKYQYNQLISVGLDTLDDDIRSAAKRKIYNVLCDALVNQMQRNNTIETL